MIVDGTGDDFQKISREKAELEKIGYQTYMIFVNTTLETAHIRNKERARNLPEKSVEQMWNNVQKNIGAFQSLFGSKNFIIVDNNDAGEDIFNKVFKRIF